MTKLRLAIVSATAGKMDSPWMHERHNAKVAVDFIMSMQEVKLPSGAVFGGPDAFRYTSTGAGSLKSKELRESWFARNGWALTSHCNKCNATTRNAIGHLFPRVFGGSWNKSTGAQHSVPECTVCNSNKGAEVATADEQYLWNEMVEVEGWME
jgi:hypothetical protein